MVMKCMPFKRACRSDPYYKRLISANSNSFWKITEAIRKPSNTLKNLIESMLTEDPEKRITLQEIKNHPWYTQSPATVDTLKLELCESISNLTEELTL